MVKRFQAGSQIKRLDHDRYEVDSQSGHGFYIQLLDGWRLGLQLPRPRVPRRKCKHLWAVEFSLKLRHDVKTERGHPAVKPNICPFCDSSELVQDGLRHNKSGDLQRFTCRLWKAVLAEHGLRANESITARNHNGYAVVLLG